MTEQVLNEVKEYVLELVEVEFQDRFDEARWQGDEADEKNARKWGDRVTAMVDNATTFKEIDLVLSQELDKNLWRVLDNLNTKLE